MEPVFGGDRVGVRADSVIEWVCVSLSVATCVFDGVGTGVVVGGSADVVSWCEKDSESETLVTESE